MLRAKDSALKVKLMDLVNRQHIIIIRHTSAEQWNAVAASGFWLLGTNAQTAVPALVEIADQNISTESQRKAIYSLAGIGPPAKEAVPSLLRWTANADPMVRNTAKFSLFVIDPEAAAKVGITNSWPRFSRSN
jgi:HEAT repeat protein